jgi:aminopeptidase YwaD
MACQEECMKIDPAVKSQRGFIQGIIDRCGPRLPGSEEERAAAGLIAGEFRAAAGNVTVEEFTLSPIACVAAIPLYGLALMVAAVVFLWQPIAAFVLALALEAFAIIQIVLYRGWLDFLFPKAVSRNVYSVIDPPGGKKNIKATLVISGHMDSAWHSPAFAKNARLARYKLTYGSLCGFALLVVSALRSLDADNLAVIPASFGWTVWLVPFLLVGFYFLSRYLVYDKSQASPGAMDNLSGIATALQLVKEFRADKKRAPKNLRVVLAAFGSEEAGLRGARAFVRRHRDGLLAGEVRVLNIDGVADKDDFICMEGEIWQMVRYDRAYVDMVEGVMKEMGLRYHRWKMEVGGTDAAEFRKAGISKAITLCAQDRTPGSNYHTKYDTLDRMDPEAMRLMNELCRRVVANIDKEAGGKS